MWQSSRSGLCVARIQEEHAENRPARSATRRAALSGSGCGSRNEVISGKKDDGIQRQYFSGYGVSAPRSSGDAAARGVGGGPARLDRTRETDPGAGRKAPKNRTAPHVRDCARQGGTAFARL